ncbi:alpha/beta hydrolase [Aquifex pyrophilus]
MLKNPLFIHGWGFSSKVFRNFRGIKYDLPAHGSNRKPYRGFGEILKELASLTWKGHDVIGWSLGGSVALLFAYFYPHKVNRLILIGTTPFFGGAWEEKNIRAMKVNIRRKGISFFRKLAYGEFEDFFDYDEGFKLLEDYVNLNLYPILRFIDKEVFIIQGTEDKIVPPSEAYRLYKSLKNAKLIFFKGGHFPVGNEADIELSLLKGGKHIRGVGGPPKGDSKKTR